MAREKSVFMLSVSAIDGTKVHAGLVRGNRFVGKKTDVTMSFIAAMLEWLSSNEKGGKRIVSSNDGSVWEVSCKRVRRGRPAERKL